METLSKQGGGEDGAVWGLAWLFWALNLLEPGPWRAQGCWKHGKPYSREALSAAVGVAASTVHMGSLLPVAPKQSLGPGGEQSRLMTE